MPKFGKVRADLGRQPEMAKQTQYPGKSGSRRTYRPKAVHPGSGRPDAQIQEKIQTVLLHRQPHLQSGGRADRYPRQGSGYLGFWGCRVTGLQGYKVSELQGWSGWWSGGWVLIQPVTDGLVPLFTGSRFNADQKFGGERFLCK